ncbi:MAG: TetR/AcrR family transcriptional regulator [Clostridiaceae bacterium]
MRKRDEITVQTKKNLIDAFWALYCEKRIEKITVKDITNKAGYNRSTFYEYFVDVYDVLEHIENSLIPSIDELPPVKMSSGTLGMPIETFMRIFEENSKYYSVLLGDNGDPAFSSKLKNSIKPAIMKVLSTDPNVDLLKIDYIVEYTLSAMIGVMSYWFRQSKQLPSDKLYQLIEQLMEDGVMKQLLR